MRLFFALPLPSAIRDAIAGLRADVGKARWIGAEQLHLTLRFLGELDEAGRDRILGEVARRAWPAPRIALRGVGTFGAPARVLWVGVVPDPALSALAADLETIAREIGLPAEPRSFSPHLTIARLKAPRASALQTFLRNHSTLELPAFQATELLLLESRLGANGSHYDPAGSFALAPP